MQRTRRSDVARTNAWPYRTKIRQCKVAYMQERLIICQRIDGHANLAMAANTRTWRIYAQGDTATNNNGGPGFIPATAVSYGENGANAPAVPECQPGFRRSSYGFRTSVFERSVR